MNANPILMQKKYTRIVSMFAKENQLTLDVALHFFYHSDLNQLVSEGSSDMHCMSDEYLVTELKLEYEERKTI